MAYQRGVSPQPATTVLTVEQARRRNAELRLALVAITAEKAQVEAKVEGMREELTVARRRLSRQIRDLDAIRTQTANIAALAEQAATTEPKHGGPDGLQAAADEIKAYEDKHLNLSKPTRRRGKGPSHGTRSKYDEGCDCDDCLGWRIRKTAQQREIRQGRAAKRAA